MGKGRRPRDFRRLAILNRGEAAVRALEGLRDYNRSRGTDIRSLLLITDADASWSFARLADEVHPLGKPTLDVGEKKISVYCHIPTILEALEETQCDALWPGWGFASEDPLLAEALEKAGIVFVGPSAAAMRLLSDKVEARRLARECGLPVAPYVVVGDIDEALHAAQEIGFPLVVKASSAGGGRGIVTVQDDSELRRALEAVKRQTRGVFGEGVIFLERLMQSCRHVEVQVVVDAFGKGVALGMRDCTVQRRFQKVVEESWGPCLHGDIARTLMDGSVRLLERAGYEGAGTVEFLYDPKEGQAWFLEVNCRLQVEHPVTEIAYGVDLFAAQLDCARGLPLDLRAKEPRTYAIEVRLCAEDPQASFAPSPGTIKIFSPATGPGVRVDSGYREGDRIPGEFDSLLAKVVGFGSDRAEAVARAARALEETEVILEGGTTNKGLLRRILTNEAFLRGTAHVRWLDEAVQSGELLHGEHAARAMCVAAVIQWVVARTGAEQRFFRLVRRGIPYPVPTPDRRPLHIALNGHAARPVVSELTDTSVVVELGERAFELDLVPSGTNALTLHLGDRRHMVTFSQQRTGIHVEIDGEPYFVEVSAQDAVVSPFPALVVDVAVRPGERVRKGQRVCTVEVMKAEIHLTARQDGVVRSVLVHEGMQVTAGSPVCEIGSSSGDEGHGGRDFQEPDLESQSPFLAWLRQVEGGDLWDLQKSEARERFARLMALCRSFFLGYLVPDWVFERALHAVESLLDHVEAPDFISPPLVSETLGCLADVEGLFTKTLVAEDSSSKATSAEAAFYEFCAGLDEDATEPVFPLKEELPRALSRYGVRLASSGLEGVRRSLWRMALSHSRADRAFRLAGSLATLLAHACRGHAGNDSELRSTLTKLASLAAQRFPSAADKAHHALYELCTAKVYELRRQQGHDSAIRVLEEAKRACHSPFGEEAKPWLDRVALIPQALVSIFLSKEETAHDPWSACALLRRVYVSEDLALVDGMEGKEGWVVRGVLNDDGQRRQVVAVLAQSVDGTQNAIEDAFPLVKGAGIVEHLVCGRHAPAEEWTEEVLRAFARTGCPRTTLNFTPDGRVWKSRTWYVDGPNTDTELILADVHPVVARRYELWRLQGFEVKRLQASDPVLALYLRARSNPMDERVIVFGEIRNLPERLDEVRLSDLWEFEEFFHEALKVIRQAQQDRGPRKRLHWNRVVVHVRPKIVASEQDILRIARWFEPSTRGLGLEKVVVRARVRDLRARQGFVDTEFVIQASTEGQLSVEAREPGSSPVKPLDPVEARAVGARQLGLRHPFEIVKMLTARPGATLAPHPDMAGGIFVRYELNRDGERLVPVADKDQWPLDNGSGIVVGIVTHRTGKYPDGMERVLIAADPTVSLGALAEPECRRIIAALDLAQAKGIPVEWIAVSAGARISMESGTENLDWTARVFRRLVEFTQDGGVVNVIVPGINVGAQSYWDAEATMLMHTKGVLIMTQAGSMVLTGKRALEASGSVAAEDERAIGGYERVMGPNGEAQLCARDLAEAYALLFRFLEHTYVKPGEPGPRRRPTSDPIDRDILEYNARFSAGAETLRDIFEQGKNPERKRAFAIRDVMLALMDEDSEPLERYRDMQDAETVVVMEAHVGSYPVCMIGTEAQPVHRTSPAPADGPTVFASGTLYPRGSYKLARALNQASGNRPVVVLANLAGFDGSPESMRLWQLEFGAEIGRAVVNFKGPIIFVVVNRYHGGAYVVFSKALNPNLHAMAVEGSLASVIGGAPAAKVVFPALVRKRANSDPRVVALREKLSSCNQQEFARFQNRLERLYQEVLLEKQAEVAREFDAIHTVERAVRVGSLDQVIAPAELRPKVIAALERALGYPPLTRAA